jgi:hypothetical protein
MRDTWPGASIHLPLLPASHKKNAIGKQFGTELYLKLFYSGKRSPFLRN